MNRMDIKENVANINELNAIMKMCKKFGVHKLTFDNLHIELFDNLNEKRASKKNLDSGREQTELSDKAESEQQDLDEMLITNPVAYEKMLSEGDLIDTRNS